MGLFKKRNNAGNKKGNNNWDNDGVSRNDIDIGAESVSKADYSEQPKTIDMLGYGQNNTAYGIYNRDRIHIAIFGETGSGKSITQLGLIRQNIERNEGFFLIDPHGMLARDVLLLIPRDKWNNVIYVNPMSATPEWFGRTVKINPLECKRPEDRYIIAMSFVNALKNLYHESWGDRLEAILRNAINALVELEDSTLRDLSMLITDAKFRAQVLRKIANRETIQFLANVFEQYKKDAGSAAYNKLDKILKTPLIAAMVDSPRSSIDISQIMKEGKFLIVDLASGASDDIAAFMGSILIHMLYVEAKRRIDNLESLETPFYLYVDEAHLFSSFALREVLNTMRKFNVKVTLATQTVNAFSTRVANEITALCRTIVCFKCDSVTAHMFKDIMPIDTDKMVSLPLHTFAFYSQAKPPVAGIAVTRKVISDQLRANLFAWKELAKYSVNQYGQQVDLQRYIPSKKNKVYPDWTPLDMKIIYLLRDKELTKDEIVAELLNRYGQDLDTNQVYESVDVLRLNHIISSSIQERDGHNYEEYKLEWLALSTFFNSKMIGARTGSEKHKATIMYIAELLWNQLTYCKMDLGEEQQELADLLTIEESRYQDAQDDKITRYDLETWGEITAIEVETDPASREEQVLKNFHKNRDQGYQVWFVVFNEKAKTAMENILTTKNFIPKDQYNVMIIDEVEIENYYNNRLSKVVEGNISGTGGITDNEMKIVAMLKSGSYTAGKLFNMLKEGNSTSTFSVESLLKVLNSLERKGLVERNAIDTAKKEVHAFTGEYRKRHAIKEYYSLQEPPFKEQESNTDSRRVEIQKEPDQQETQIKQEQVEIVTEQAEIKKDELELDRAYIEQGTVNLSPSYNASKSENNDKSEIDKLLRTDITKLSDDELKSILRRLEELDDNTDYDLSQYKDAVTMLLDNRGHRMKKVNGKITFYRIKH